MAGCGNAADALMAVFGYRRVHKSISDLDAFDRLVAQVSEAIAAELSEVEAAAFARVMALADLPWLTLSQAELNAALGGITAVLPSPGKLSARLTTVLASFLPSVLDRSRAAVSAQVGAELGGVVNADVVRYLRNSESLAVTDYLKRRNEGVSAAIRSAIADGLSKGASRNSVMAEIERRVGPAAILGRSVNYYDVVAGQFIGAARTYGMLTGMRDAEITEYEFHAVLDEVTSTICRALDGRIFSVEAALRRYDLAASSPEASKQALPWVHLGTDYEGKPVLYTQDALGGRVAVAQVIRSGAGNIDDRGEYKLLLNDAELAARGIPVPPCHANCRSVVLPRL